MNALFRNDSEKVLRSLVDAKGEPLADGAEFDAIQMVALQYLKGTRHGLIGPAASPLFHDPNKGLGGEGFFGVLFSQLNEPSDIFFGLRILFREGLSPFLIGLGFASRLEIRLLRGCELFLKSIKLFGRPRRFFVVGLLLTCNRRTRQKRHEQPYQQTSHLETSHLTGVPSEGQRLNLVYRKS